MRSTRLVAALAATLAAWQWTAPAGANPPGPAAQPPAERPRLIVLIVADQFGSNLLDLHQRHLTGGVRTLLDRGRRYEHATVDHAPTNSLPGHLTVATGAHPRRHGIIDNSWVERRDGEIVRITGFEDGSCQTVGPAPLGRQAARPAIGPGRFEAPTIAEWVIAADPRARFASVGTGRGVSALHAGRARGPVLWFEAERGAYVSSTCYLAKLPDWAVAFNAGLEGGFMAADWTLSAPAAMLAGVRPDRVAFEHGGEDIAFPHARPAERSAVPGWFIDTPFADEATLGLARAAVDGEGLGVDAVPDILTVGLSSLDHVGHGYGPFSVEQADALHRLDRALGEFFVFLDARVGDGNWVLALTADHGAPPAPEAARGMGFADARRISRDEVFAAIGRIADAAAAAPDEASRTAAAAEAARRIAFVDRVLVADDLASASDPMTRLYANAYRRGRVSRHPFYEDDGGRGPANHGLIVVTRPHVVVDWATSIHGSPHDYDRQVVMLFYGDGIAPGTIQEPARTVDVAPTLGAIAGIRPLRPLDGRNLAPDAQRLNRRK